MKVSISVYASKPECACACERAMGRADKGRVHKRDDEDVAGAMGSWKGDYATLGQVGWVGWNTAQMLR